MVTVRRPAWSRAARSSVASGGSEADRLVAQDRASEELWSSWVGQQPSLCRARRIRFGNLRNKFAERSYMILGLWAFRGYA